MIPEQQGCGITIRILGSPGFTLPTHLETTDPMVVDGTGAQNSRPLLKVEHLSTYFYTEDGVVKAVDGVDLDVQRGEVFGLVGESGCGKSVTALSILRLIEAPGRIVQGAITFDGQKLDQLPEREMVNLRGKNISMIFQQPLSSLNPVFTIGTQVAEVFQIHEGMRRSEAWKRAVDLLRIVGIPDPESRAKSYPHELSGGQAQRVMIAMALALDPQLLIADEPTTALDVTIQAQILDLMRALSRRWQHGGHPDHPRSGGDRRNGRPGSRDVRRAHRRTGLGGGPVRPAASPLYPGADRLRAYSGPTERPPGRHPRHRPRPVGHATGLPFRSALYRPGGTQAGNLHRARARPDRNGTRATVCAAICIRATASTALR